MMSIWAVKRAKAAKSSIRIHTQGKKLSFRNIGHSQERLRHHLQLQNIVLILRKESHYCIMLQVFDRDITCQRWCIFHQELHTRLLISHSAAQKASITVISHSLNWQSARQEIKVWVSILHCTVLYKTFLTHLRR